MSAPPPSTVADSAPPVAVVPAPAQKRLAPEGVFFLLTKKSVETDAGIIGLRPGTQVVRQPDGKFLVEGHTLDLAPGEITNDLDIAVRVAGADTRSQAVIRQTLAARPAASVHRPEPVTESRSSNSASESGASPSTPAQRSESSLGGSNSLGAAHTRTQDGWLYQKNSDGEWERIRRLR